MTSSVTTGKYGLWTVTRNEIAGTLVIHVLHKDDPLEPLYDEATAAEIITHVLDFLQCSTVCFGPSVDPIVTGRELDGITPLLCPTVVRRPKLSLEQLKNTIKDKHRYPGGNVHSQLMDYIGSDHALHCIGMINPLVIRDRTWTDIFSYDPAEELEFWSFVSANFGIRKDNAYIFNRKRDVLYFRHDDDEFARLAAIRMECQAPGNMVRQPVELKHPHCADIRESVETIEVEARIENQVSVSIIPQVHFPSLKTLRILVRRLDTCSHKEKLEKEPTRQVVFQRRHRDIIMDLWMFLTSNPKKLTATTVEIRRSSRACSVGSTWDYTEHPPGGGRRMSCCIMFPSGKVSMAKERWLE